MNVQIARTGRGRQAAGDAARRSSRRRSFLVTSGDDVPIPLAPRPADVLQPTARGVTSPRAIAWFGFTSFWGHLRHLLASAIATENIDARTWMIPDPPPALLEAMVAVLAGRGATPSDTLAGALGGEVWIDFVADTGDDATVSEAVARLLAEDYETADPDDASRALVLPRGHVLFHGGDLAYPVATTLEMTRRLVDPWNRVLEAAARTDEASPRVLVAVPGNHDWYDGLDGFARLCQAPCGFEEPYGDALHPAPSKSPLWAWAEAFARGEAVRKPGAMALAGYVPVQRASYFRVPLTKELELFAVDRQLRQVDPRQKAYFAVPREGTRGRLLVLPDPVRAWGEHRPDGVASLVSLGIDPSRDPSYVLTGDVHHYERSKEGPSVHVISGGGGAFLHGARVAKRGARYPRDAEFPGPIASRALLRRLPWIVARGGAGWVVIAVFGLADAVSLVPAGLGARPMSFGLAAAMSVSVALGAGLLVGWRRHRLGRVIVFSMLLGVLVGALPIVLGLGLDAAGVHELGHGNVRETVTWSAAWMLATWTSGLAFGGLLQLIAWLGLNHAQPYAALGEPGYKNFARLRVREGADGRTTVDTFVIGQIDPVGRSPALLVDSFRWGP
jgi:hypothetical protein